MFWVYFLSQYRCYVQGMLRRRVRLNRLQIQEEAAIEARIFIAIVTKNLQRKFCQLRQRFIDSNNTDLSLQLHWQRAKQRAYMLVCEIDRN
jgi:hypothetical protein